MQQALQEAGQQRVQGDWQKAECVENVPKVFVEEVTQPCNKPCNKRGGRGSRATGRKLDVAKTLQKKALRRSRAIGRRLNVLKT